MYNLFLDDNFTPLQIADLPKTSSVYKTKYRTLEWLIVRSYDDFVATINQLGLPDMVSFDHDLAPEHYELIYNDENWAKADDEINIDYSIFQEKTGWHDAKWLIKYCEKNCMELPRCLIHSQNPIGAKNLTDIIYR